MSDNPIEKMPFAELLARARAGQREARGELFRRSAKRLKQRMRSQRRPVGTGGDRPSDISQGILERALLGFDSFKENTEGQWFRWLQRITTNDGKQAVRDASRQKRAPGDMVSLDEEGAPEPVSPERSLSQNIAREQDYKRIYAAVFQLPKNQSRAVYLRYLRDMDRDEVAKDMNMTKSVVSSLISRGLERLATQSPHLDPARTDGAESSAPNDVETAFLAYLRRLEAGEEINTEDWLAGHPSCAETLRGMLSVMEQLHTHSLPGSEKK